MSGSPISFDLQLAGVLDDGTPEGAIRAKLATGELVAMPFSDGSYGTSLAGTSGASFNGGAVPSNPDGSGSGFFVSVPAGSSVSQQGAVISFVAYGTVLGLRYALPTAGTPDFGVKIDGVAYEVPSTQLVPSTQVAMSAGLDPAHLFIVADDLPDLPQGHYCEVVFPYSSSGALAWSLYGYLVERRRGYQPMPRALGFYEIGLVSSVAARIIPGANGWRGLRKVLYHNTTASPVDITITLSGNAIKVVTVPASGDAEWDLGEVTAVQRASSAGTAALFHAAATTNVVRATALVGL